MREFAKFQINMSKIKRVNLQWFGIFAKKKEFVDVHNVSHDFLLLACAVVWCHRVIGLGPCHCSLPVFPANRLGIPRRQRWVPVYRRPEQVGFHSISPRFLLCRRISCGNSCLFCWMFSAAQLFSAMQLFASTIDEDFHITSPKAIG